ncbi:helix-turn-helix domain-containing protein [Streptomyces sp. H39-C1]|uniref:helix-turn-helix domain-containing protein n=1 Tax=Streptomyces sp. H39-C1 TaxID=3004355 RepID=UPI0022AFF2E7|nr:helix-turn-helix domain-containing protein [Streptomyces sp. H39-C1]MCZ4096006.1 helix-turn-helix domain-containing protein [Streptomyces sp. H39-C1]
MSSANTHVAQLLYTPEEAAVALRFGRSTVYELMASGELKWCKRGRSRRIKASDLVAFVESLTAQPN